jgi:hypothetical protein
MASLHLRFKESSELALDGPSNAVSFFMPAFDDVFAVWKNVSVCPSALVYDQFSDRLRLLILLCLCSLD